MPVAKRTPLKVDNWIDHVDKWKNCRRCGLCEQRDRIVLARGTVPCDVLFIGEAPGASEDAHGLPFYGPAGDRLDYIIDRSVPHGVRYALTNLVACFPREAKLMGENEPTPDEIRACRPRLMEFVNIARPRVIVRVGRLATNWATFKGAKYVDIDHPAYILRMKAAQKQMATDKCIVVVRNAVADMIEYNYPNFTIQGDEHASCTTNGYLDSEIPF